MVAQATREPNVDIKDFILIGGGLLIAAVVAHGFWIAWRERRQDLRIDIKPDLIPEQVNEIERLRGELPNGGGRVIKGPDPQQDSLELETPPLLLEPTEPPPAFRKESAVQAPHQEPSQAKREPVFTATDRAAPEEVDAVLFGSDWRVSAEEMSGTGNETPRRTEPVLGGSESPARREPALDGRTAPAQPESTDPERAKVAEVDLPEMSTSRKAPADPIVADEPKRPRRLGQRKSNERKPASTGRSTPEETSEVSAAVPVEELIVMNVLAGPDNAFTGDELFTTLRTCGLKFGEMNIFHRLEPLTRSVQYSVASAREPGTFDMADMEAIRCPGLCLFMQLPGPDEPVAAFEDMLSVARSVVKTLGGEVRDEHRNIMTPQTVEHYRQRIVDFSRRRMSKRA